MGIKILTCGYGGFEFSAFELEGLGLLNSWHVTVVVFIRIKAQNILNSILIIQNICGR